MGAGRRKRTGRARAPARRAQEPISLEPVDLLAGLASGVELDADELPAGVADAAQPTRASVTVDDVGRLLRSGDDTVRRLIRSPGLRPSAGRPRRVIPRSHPPDKPGE